MVKFDLYDDGHLNDEAFRNIKRARLNDLSIAQKPFPLHERFDQLKSTASAINKGLDFVPRYDTSVMHHRLKENELLYQNAAGKYSGARIIASDTLRGTTFKSKRMEKMKQRFMLDEDHILNTLSEANYGFKERVSTTKTTTSRQAATTSGSLNHVHHRGFERMRNPTIYPELARNVNERDVEVNEANHNVFRFNDVTVDTIETFPTVGF